MAVTLSAGSLTDAQARNLVIKSLRNARRFYRTADTLGEKVEREVDRLIKRKTRINATSLTTLFRRYSDYEKAVNAIQIGLQDAGTVVAQF